MRLTWGVPLFAVLLLGAACSSGGDEGSQPSPTATTVAPVPTEAPTTTIASTTSTSTAPPTTPAPTTTIDPTEALIAEIEADLNAGEQALVQGAADPASEESRANLEQYFTDAALRTVLEFYDVLVAEGFVVRPNPDVPSVVDVMSVEELLDGGRAVVTYCRIDSAVVIQQLDGGTEIIVNDEIIRYEVKVEVLRNDRAWANRGGGEVLAEQLGATTCV